MSISNSSTKRCGACKNGVTQPFPFSMAFQPIIDVLEGRVFAYEALVRGPNNEPASSVLSQVTEANRYSFDQTCRVVALTQAKRLGLDRTDARLSINFMPGAIYSPAACIQLTLNTARDLSFSYERLIFELTEAEEVRDRNHLRAIFMEYRRHGFQLALDDFGAGFCGLNLFADVTPDILKIDMDLTRNLHTRPVAFATTQAITKLCESLGILVIAEGVETLEEYGALRRCGLRLMQGYLLAKPGFESLPDFHIPEDPHVDIPQVVEPDGNAAMASQDHRPVAIQSQYQVAQADIQMERSATARM